jgi:hypothetical protein
MIQPHTHAFLRSLGLLTTVLLCLAISVQANAQMADNKPQQQDISLDDQIQSLKKELLQLNRDLFLLEEELLFPASTQLVVFVSMGTGTLFALDSVELKVNDKTVANYLYTKRELDALKRGGVQQLYIGNIPSGENEIVAFFTGKGPHGREFRRGTSQLVDKGSDPRYVELKIIDDPVKQQPDFQVKIW